MNRTRNISIIVLVSIAVIGTLIILFCSPAAKYLLERNITVDWIYVNPFTGYVHLHNVKIFENNSDRTFLSIKGVGANIALLKLFSQTYEISEITLTQPRGRLIQNKRKFNIDDLIQRFSSIDSIRSPVHFTIMKIKIVDGTFYYKEELIPIDYFIKKVNLESRGKHWDSDTISANVSFVQGMGSGTINGKFTINVKNRDYQFSVVAKSFDLNIIQQYLRDLTNYGSFTANLEADIKATGNFDEQQDITVTGIMTFQDFHFGKNESDEYAGFKKLKVNIIELSPKKRIFQFDSVLLSNPYFKYERYDYLDNIQTMFGKGGAKVVAAHANPARFNLVIEIARYVKALSTNFFQSDYKISHINISHADLKFNDYSINEKFAGDLYPLFITADSIDKDHRRINVHAHSGIKPYGDISVELSINPKDSSDFDMHYHLRGLPASLFNPYTITYTSFSLDRGTLEVKGEWHVRNGIIKSDNHLILIDPRTTKRLRKDDTKWMPLPLIMSLIRERGNAVDYRIPIAGDLKNPKFKLGDELLDLLTNIFVKPPTTPYGWQVNKLEADIEKALTWTWPLRTSSVLASQEIFIERIANFLADNPQASVVIHPQFYAIKEMEYLLYFEAKKKYFLHREHIGINSFEEKDSIAVDKMFIKDALFIQYLDKQIPDSTVFTILEKCERLIGDETIRIKLEALRVKRAKNFTSYFVKKNVSSQIIFSKEISTIPYNGFSFYKIDYDGTFPKSIMNAYEQMKEFNNKSPRKKFQKERNSREGAL
jgi:hypothetical protein